MYHILIVDDEMFSVEAVVNAIDWNALQADQVLTAYNSRMAKERFEQNRIDVMVCDIEMPRGSGLELASWVKERFPDTICLFLTCHCDFSYAKEAISLGAFDYLLKPIAYEELQQALARATAEYQKRADLNSYKDKWVLHQESVQGQNAAGPDHAANADAAPDGPQNNDPAGGTVIDRLKEYILENLSSDLSREELARRFYLNPDYLSRIFRRETGLSLQAYIMQQRISRAKELLRASTLTISEIHEQCGFANSSYFSKIFKRETGRTPQEYRAGI